MAAEVFGDAPVGDAADAGTDFLDDDHERQTEEHGPGKAVAELGADLALGGDATGVVVGRAGDEAGAEMAE